MTVDTNAYGFRIVWSPEDDSFIATCPEFEGISGIGRSAEGAMREVRTALRLALETYASEGWELPGPQTLASYSGQFRLRIPRSLHARLAQRAEDEGVSLNSLSMALLAEGIGERTVRGGSRRALRITP